MRLKKKRTLVVATILIIVALAVALISGFWFRPFARQRYVTAFPKIKVGDDKQIVLELLGKPDEITDCYTIQYSALETDLKAKCAEQYWYRAFIQEWIVVFDQNGKVILKSHNISQ